MNDHCLACQEKRRHTKEEYALNHPMGGHGIADGKWCCAEAREKSISERLNAVA